MHARIHRGLHADDLDGWIVCLGNGCHARDQAAAANRHNQHVEIRHIFEHFQCRCPLAGHDQRVVERVNPGQALALADEFSMLLGLVERCAFKQDAGSEGARMLDLVERGRDGHGNGHRNPESAAMKGHALRMIAGRGGDHADFFLVLSQPGQLVQSAALLEGGGELEVLKLHPDFSAGDRRECARAAHGRALNLPFKNPGSILHILKAYRQLFTHCLAILSNRARPSYSALNERASGETLFQPCTQAGLLCAGGLSIRHATQ